LNRRPADFQSATLPTELLYQTLIGIAKIGLKGNYPKKKLTALFF